MTFDPRGRGAKHERVLSGVEWRWRTERRPGWRDRWRDRGWGGSDGGTDALKPLDVLHLSRPRTGALMVVITPGPSGTAKTGAV